MRKYENLTNEQLEQVYLMLKCDIQMIESEMQIRKTKQCFKRLREGTNYVDLRIKIDEPEFCFENVIK